MSEPSLARDETILGLLRERGAASTLELVAQLGMDDWTVRRGLRRLIDGGYVFSPERGRYRITALGVAVLAPLPDVGRRVGDEAATQPPPDHFPTHTPAPTGPVDDTRGKLWARMARQR
jgi:hypothetical protein